MSWLRSCTLSLRGPQRLGRTLIRAEKNMTATDVTGFDAIFSTGFFAAFSRF